uniref:Uncharacterized protein n=1 Tax=Lepeophtheirus salmonis TaxID=72036 RepID=A0A0K2V1D5_LEPSM
MSSPNNRHDNSAPYTRNGLWEVMSSMTMSMTRLNTNPEIATPWRIHDPKPTLDISLKDVRPCERTNDKYLIISEGTPDLVNAHSMDW